MVNNKRFKIGVFGSAGGSELEEQILKAHAIGVNIALNGGILCTGACSGIPHEAALDAAKQGASVLGFSPAINFKEHIATFNFPVAPYVLVFTGMGLKGRNVICTRTCDAGIFISGRYGTMNEFTLMYDEGEGKIIGLLEGSGGFVDSMIIPSLKDTEKKSKAVIVTESDPRILVEKVFENLKEFKR
ncbi:MAG: hypothetical protein ABIH91_03725 [Candidatus Omnitrophota bacterium]